MAELLILDLGPSGRVVATLDAVAERTDRSIADELLATYELYSGAGLASVDVQRTGLVASRAELEHLRRTLGELWDSGKIGADVLRQALDVVRAVRGKERDRVQDKPGAAHGDLDDYFRPLWPRVVQTPTARDDGPRKRHLVYSAALKKTFVVPVVHGAFGVEDIGVLHGDAASLHDVRCDDAGVARRKADAHALLYPPPPSPTESLVDQLEKSRSDASRIFERSLEERPTLREDPPSTAASRSSIGAAPGHSLWTAQPRA